MKQMETVTVDVTLPCFPVMFLLCSCYVQRWSIQMHNNMIVVVLVYEVETNKDKQKSKQVSKRTKKQASKQTSSQKGMQPSNRARMLKK